MVWLILCKLILNGHSLKTFAMDEGAINIKSKATETNPFIPLKEFSLNSKFQVSQIKIIKAVDSEIVPSKNSDIKSIKILNQLDIESATLNVELALTEFQQQQGLMFRKNLEDGYGMLFVFKNERPRSFWMKNTLIPLSIAFIDKNKTIFQIGDLKPIKTLAEKKYDNISSFKPAKYVLEVPKGWFEKNNIKVESRFEWKDEQKYLQSQ